MTRSLVYRIFRKDLGRKAVALMLALLVWSVLSQQLSDERTVPLDVITVAKRSEAEQQLTSVPAIYVVVPDSLIVRSLNHKQISVFFRGLKDEVDGMELSAVLEVPPDVLSTRESVNDDVPYVITLDRSMFRSQDGVPSVSEMSISPRRLKLVLAESTSEEFDLSFANVQVVGTPRAGYFADTRGARVEPNQVVLSGPRSEITRLRRDPSLLRLSPIDIGEQSLDVVRQVGLDSSIDPGITLETVGQVVSVAVPVRPSQVERELFSVPVTYKNSPALEARNQKAAEATEKIDLVLVGPRNVLDAYTDAELRDAIQPTFDWRDAELERATDTVRFFVTLPDSVEIQGPDQTVPEIKYRLEPLHPETSPEAAGEAPAGTGDTP